MYAENDPNTLDKRSLGNKSEQFSKISVNTLDTKVKQNIQSVNVPIVQKNYDTRYI